ncbi:hypothetical protein NC652_003499 [Populus alba x Populus x berolinensis]|nr:hypothetical protein NC652_003499 [Populus alba x Populus x berolinensis]
MAAKESGEFLHGAVALLAFHGPRDPTRSHWEIEAAARTRNVMDPALVITEGQIKAHDRHLFLPQVNTQAMFAKLWSCDHWPQH